MSKIGASNRAHIITVTPFAGNANYFVKSVLPRSRRRKEAILLVMAAARVPYSTGARQFMHQDYQ
jgi:hypothetical protein